MLNRCNVAQVGIGGWGMNIARTIREDVPGLNLHRVASRNGTLDKCIGTESIIHRDWRELLRCGDIDAVFLAVPPSLHLEMTTAFVEAGIAVFVEKPMALSSVDAEQLLETVAANNAIVRVDHIDLYNPAILELKNNAAEWGRLRTIKGKIGGTYDRRTDISPLWEYGPHFVAVCIDLNCGAPTSVHARLLPCEIDPKDDPSREIVVIEMEFSNGVEACIEAGNGMRAKCRTLDLEYRHVHFRYDDRGESHLVRVLGDGKITSPIHVSKTLPLTRSIQDFENCVRNGDTCLDSVRMGVDVVRVLEAASVAIGEN